MRTEVQALSDIQKPAFVVVLSHAKEHESLPGQSSAQETRCTRAPDMTPQQPSYHCRFHTWCRPGKCLLCRPKSHSVHPQPNLVPVQHQALLFESRIRPCAYHALYCYLQALQCEAWKRQAFPNLGYGGYASVVKAHPTLACGRTRRYNRG